MANQSKHACFPIAIRQIFGMVAVSFGLLVTSVSGIAAQLSWSPQWIDFGQVPIGATAYQTLTLTNEDTVSPITVTGVEFTFNQGGAFAWSASVPTEISPDGGSLAVELSFTPNDISFAMADLWVYSDSDTPALYIQLLGEGSVSDPCIPLTQCGDSCVDLQNDVDNCGTCFNACPTVVNGASACEAGDCTFTCNEGYEPVGDECVGIVAQTPLEMLQELIAFAEASRVEGTLVGLGPGASAEHRADAWFNMLDAAEDLLNAGELDEACGQLRSAQLRCDGGYPFYYPLDFVAGEVIYILSDGLLEIMEALEDAYGYYCTPGDYFIHP